MGGREGLEPVMHFQQKHGDGGPKARDKPARGNALGTRRGRSSPVGAGPTNRGGHFFRPFKGFGFFPSQTQGVALGWLVAAPLVLRGEVHHTLASEVRIETVKLLGEVHHTL